MRVGFIVFGLFLGWSLVANPAEAGVAITKNNRTWETAAKIGSLREPALLFGALGSTGDVQFFSMTVKKTGTITAALDVPVWATTKFHPQLVVYQPDGSTTGPTLPMVQPPETIALVYPLTERDRRFEAWTQISTIHRLRTTLDLPVTGTYYFAVYNAGSESGRFRLTLTPPTAGSVTNVMGWPRCWWISHIWATPSITTLFAPLVFLGGIIVILWMWMHWLRPVTEPVPKKRKVSTTRRAKK